MLKFDLSYYEPCHLNYYTLCAMSKVIPLFYIYISILVLELAASVYVLFMELQLTHPQISMRFAFGTHIWVKII